MNFSWEDKTLYFVILCYQLEQERIVTETSLKTMSIAEDHFHFAF